VAALFVPFPYAVDDHQTTNAEFLSERDAAVLVQQRDLSPEALADWLRAQTRETLAEMAGRARSLAKPEATDRVAQVCAAVAQARQKGKQ
jgi:UDP-N-acetylglucosamine--N-acetylmuramyl-(pentapeptide) pyrophosphoryl-undecaprenol N-acetylglucosamine transferase